MVFSTSTYPHTKMIGFEIYKYNYTNVYEIWEKLELSWKALVVVLR